MSTKAVSNQRRNERNELGIGSPSTTSSSASATQPGEQFDSLQKLLEDAGYKETRIFTPLTTKTPASPPLVTKTRVASRMRKEAGRSIGEQSEQNHGSVASASATSSIEMAKECSTDVEHAKAMAANSSWFTASWSTLTGRGSSSASVSSSASIRKKQSEPALRRRTDDASGWASSSLWRFREPKATEQVRAPCQDAAEEESQQPPIEATREAPAVDVVAPRLTLRHAPSTQHLWQASVKHHRQNADQKTVHRCRSFPAKIAVSEGRPTASLDRKQSFDGARLVSGVGVRAATRNGTMPSDETVFVPQHGKRGMGVRNAFKELMEEERAPSQGERDMNRASLRDSISSLGDLEEDGALSKGSSAKPQSPIQPTPAKSSPSSSARIKAIECSAELFAIPAAPLLSLDGAVAMRNGACLEFGASPPSSTRSAGRLRKMRSVDALELALARMQTQKSASTFAFREVTIPESSSTDSMNAEDFANAKTTEIGNDLMSSSESGVDIRRCPTPTLVITSPTGVRPPQPLLLDGIEFEPRSVSPKGAGTAVARPIAKRAGWKLSVRRAPDVVAEVEPANSVTEQRGRSESSRVIPPRSSSKLTKMKPRSKNSVDEAHLQAPTLRKRRTTASCGNLRRSSERGPDATNIRSSIGKLSMSEQIHALHRSVQERSRSSASAPVCIPRSPTEQDVDDPFNDFVAVAANINGRNDDSGRAIDRSKMSPVPFESSKNRSPLGQNTTARNQAAAAVEDKASIVVVKPVRTASQPSVAGGKSLSGKRSGVGLACLVDLDQRSAASKRNDAMTRPAPAKLLGRMRKEGSSSSTLSDSPSRTSPASKLHGMSSLDSAEICSAAPMMLVNDENADPYLDSPTARAGHRVLKRRNSRPRAL